MPVREVLPFIVEDGSGRVDATAYCDLAFCEAYADRILDDRKTAWIAADTLTKQQCLVQATATFDDYVYFPQGYTPYRNRRLTRFQALQFPRVGLVDEDGFLINERSVPLFVKNCVSMLAVTFASTDLLAEPIRGVKSASVGPLSVTFSENYNHQPVAIPRTIRMMVSRFGGKIRGSYGNRSVSVFRS